MAKRKHKKVITKESIKEMINPSMRKLTGGFINGLSSPRKGSIWMNCIDGYLFEVMSDKLHTAISGIVTIQNDEIGVVDMFINEFYSKFTLWKNNIPSKLERKCICVDYLNNNPDPVPNPDCPIHGKLKPIKEI